MQAFQRLAAIAAPLPRPNIDTDAIIAVQDLLVLSKRGLGAKLFRRWRFAESGEPVADFVLNRPAFAAAKILVAGENFGCGSSREHAVWALQDFGLRCIIAPSFASIFQENALKNGLLPVSLPADVVQALLATLAAQPGAQVSVDLEACTVTLPDGSVQPFAIAPAARETLLQGLDPIDLALRHEAALQAFQARQRRASPWIWRGA
jgi:3-isopropylmalate/(R)-2-methylmalate dehydratase small subunit